MRGLRSKLSGLYFHPRTFPLALLILMFLSFGVFIPWLGLYWDDWPIVASTHLRGVNFFWEYYQGERPFSAWTYLLTIPILGTRPLTWHIFTLLLRWMTVLLMWWSLRSLWPERTREVTWMALLFGIYPAFEQQPVSVIFSQHWMTYALYFLSIFLMIYSVRSTRWTIVATIMALFAQGVHLWTMEYFAGLELLRPVILWFLAEEIMRGFFKKSLFVLRRWLPYLLVLILFVYWRLYIMEAGGTDPNEPVVLKALPSAPVNAIISMVQYAIQDFINVIFAAWSKTLDPNIFNLSDRLVLFSMLLTLLGFALASVYLSRLKDVPNSDVRHSKQRDWVRRALLLGFIAFLLGPLPVWLTDRFTFWRIYSSRYSLASIFGASVLWVAFLGWLTYRRMPRIIVIAAMFGLAVGFHVRWTNDFRWIWKDQLRFYWQLYWRAPNLKPGTTIAADGELFPYVGRYSTALAVNLLYPQSEYPDTDYWFYEIGPSFSRNQDIMLKGSRLKFSYRKFEFTGTTLNSLLVSYQSEKGNCLWILSPFDEDNPDLLPMLADATPISNLDRIASQPASIPLAEVFGEEPEHGWCYYFEKADLARQFNDWQEVARLGDEAQKLNFGPNNPQEWMPFIQGYAMAGRWEQAIKTTTHVWRVNRSLSPRVCRLWEQIFTNTVQPLEFNEQLTTMLARLKCSATD